MAKQQIRKLHGFWYYVGSNGWLSQCESFQQAVDAAIFDAFKLARCMFIY